MTVEIHPTALVSSKAEIEDGVRIGPYCVVSDKVRIGAGTELKAFVSVHDYVEMGHGCNVYENTVLGGDPQDRDFKGEETWVLIGNNNIIRENVTINRSTGEGSCTSVGNDCFLMEGVHLAHNVKIGNNVTIANKAGFAGHSSVGDNAVIGGIAGVHQFVRIGRLCMVGGLSKIVKDIPPFMLVDGHPGRIFGINRVGLKRAGYDASHRSAVKSLYKSLYHSGLPFRKAISEIEETMSGNPFTDEILDFLRGSKRGVEFWPKVIINSSGND